MKVMLALLVCLLLLGTRCASAEEKLILQDGAGQDISAVIYLPEGQELPALVRIRYHHAGEAAVLRRTGTEEVTVYFEKPVRAPPPGQSAVFYDTEGCIIGGGIIAGSC